MKRLKSLAAALFVLALWQAGASSGLLDPMVFPSPEDVAKSLVKGLAGGDLPIQILFSLELIGKGLLISGMLAILTGYACMKMEGFRKIVETIVTLIHPLPGVALLPLVILWVGTGKTAIIIIIVHGAFWPLMQNVLTGIAAIPYIYFKVGDNYGLSIREQIFRISIPASAPFIIAGFKIAWARAWRALISAEMIFGAAGLAGGIGWAIYKSRVFMDIAGIVSGLAVIMLIGITVEKFVFGFIEKRTVEKWGMTE
ncbi:MAG TPA: ABC transporter permease subunit [Clostridia bacterium]|nr:ABC transporter permease subunit [Clostridia bacterium]